MERSIKILTIEEINKNNSEDKYDFRFEVFEGIQAQRNYVWDNFCGSLLIDSILRDMPMGSCCTAVINGKYAVMDGQQRLFSIIRYINDDFMLNNRLEKLGMVDIAKKKFSELPIECQNKILNTKISFEEIEVPLEKKTNKISKENCKKLIEIFIRLNSGKKLTNMEIWKAQLGTKVKFLNKVIEQDFFETIKVKNNERGAVLEVALNMIMFQVNSLTNLNKSETEAFIKVVSNFNDFAEDVKDSILEKNAYLNEAFNREDYHSMPDGKKYLKKTHVQQLFLLTELAINNKIAPDKFFNWANNFFYVKRDAKHEYWLKASGSSTTGAVQTKAIIIQKEFKKAFKIK